MPRRKKKEVEIDDYRHDEKRPNNPEAGLAAYDAYAPERKTYSYDPHLDPQLVWAGKAEHLSFEVDTVPLHIHERVSSKAILAKPFRGELVPTEAELARREGRDYILELAKFPEGAWVIGEPYSVIMNSFSLMKDTR